MRKIALITTLLLATTGAHAEGAWAVGRGNDSCATWLSSPANEIAGVDYILGFWTGLNIAAPTGSHGVGFSTDNAGIVGEVRRICRLSPSSSLIVASMSAYRLIREREFPGTK